MFNPFRKVLVYKDIRSGCNVVYWRMDKDIRYSPNAILSVDYARAGGPWLTLAPDVSNTCMYIDNRATNFNKINNDVYRLCLRLSDKLVYYSLPQMLRWLDGLSSGKVNNLLRLAYKEMAITGRHGHLLKRKLWGLRCPMCTDLPGDSSVNLHCPCCFGTGYKGGYYDGIPLDILLQQLQMIEGVLQIGATQASVLQAKMLAWPYIGLGDVWIDDATDQRYAIQNAIVASKFKSVPLIYQVTMHLLLGTDVMHSTQADRKLDKGFTPDWDKEFDAV